MLRAVADSLHAGRFHSFTYRSVRCLSRPCLRVLNRPLVLQGRYPGSTRQHADDVVTRSNRARKNCGRDASQSSGLRIKREAGNRIADKSNLPSDVYLLCWENFEALTRWGGGGGWWLLSIGSWNHHLPCILPTRNNPECASFRLLTVVPHICHFHAMIMQHMQ